jgi:methionine-rich copper-binding protein CopC
MDVPRRLSPTVAAACAFAVVLTVGVAAHMKLQKSEPAANSTVTAPVKTIQIWFSEAPDSTVSKIDLKGPSGSIKTAGLRATGKSLVATVDGATAGGRYVVAWQSAGDDGHVQKGEFAFTVKASQ